MRMCLFGSSDSERRIDEMMRKRFVDWRVDKQVIVVPPESDSRALVKATDVQLVDFTWPRIIRVTITNNSQTHLIGDCGMGAQHEAQFDALLQAAEEQCVFLNANKVR